MVADLVDTFVPKFSAVASTPFETSPPISVVRADIPAISIAVIPKSVPAAVPNIATAPVITASVTTNIVAAAFTALDIRYSPYR